MVSIVFVFIDAINSVDRIDSNNFIDPGVINFSVLHLKGNSNDPTNSGVTFWGKKGVLFKITGIYWYLKIFHEVCLRNK